jgi:hypothetical protein
MTYGNRGTTKPGVIAHEHAVAHSWGHDPQLLGSEPSGIMPNIAIVMTEKERPLQPTSRINFGIHYPIQYNVKVKDIGYVPQTQIPSLINNWRRVCEGLSVAVDEPVERRTPSPLHGVEQTGSIASIDDSDKTDDNSDSEDETDAIEDHNKQPNC